MIRLNDRLQKIAGRIEQGETMVDIGTDHGFLPISLLLTGKCPRVIMADISQQSLSKAVDKAGEYSAFDASLRERMDFRAGDGISVLKPGEVDVVVIAGMGGKLIRDILAVDLAHTATFGKFILQPRIGQGHLRKWLLENGYAIVHEDLAIEGKHIPEIITAVRLWGREEAEGSLQRQGVQIFPNASLTELGGGFDASLDGNDIRWRIPPWILRADGPVEEFLCRNISTEREKLANVERAKQRNTVLEEKIKDDIIYLEGLLRDHAESGDREQQAMDKGGREKNGT